VFCAKRRTTLLDSATYFFNVMVYWQPGEYMVIMRKGPLDVYGGPYRLWIDNDAPFCGPSLTRYC
jgi:hypothetical protein